MDYSVTSLKTIAECDAVLTAAKVEARDLAIRKLTLEKNQDKYAANSVETVAELASAQAELNAVNQILPTLAAGTYKDDEIIRQSRLNTRVLTLTNDLKNFGSVPMLLRQSDLARVELEAAEMERFIKAVETRKAAI